MKSSAAVDKGSLYSRKFGVLSTLLPLARGIVYERAYSYQNMKKVPHVYSSNLTITSEKFKVIGSLEDLLTFRSAIRNKEVIPKMEGFI